MPALLRWYPVLLAAAIMAPRLWWACFGLLDDGIQLDWAPAMLHDPKLIPTLMVVQGRTLPVKDLYWTLIWVVGGASPFVWYLAQTVLLAGSGMFFTRGLEAFGATRLQALGAWTLLALSPPAVESFYTLSKSEPLLIAGMSVYLWLLSGPLRSWRSRFALGLIALLAPLTKETAIALAPVTLLWALLDRRRWWLPAVLTWAGVLTAVLLRLAAIGWKPGTGTYGSVYQLTLTNAVHFVLTSFNWLWRDVPWLAPALWVLWRGWAMVPESRRPLVWGGIIWTAGWAGVFAGWPSLSSYYLAPAMLGLALVAFPAACLAWERRAEFRVSAWLLFALLGVGLLNGSAYGVQQVNTDRVNARLLDYLARLPAGTNVWFDVTEPHEYVEEARIQLRLFGRSDLRLDYWKQHAVTQPTVLVSAWIDNQSEPGPRALHGRTVRAWRTTLPALLPPEAKLVFETSAQGPYLAVAGNKVSCWAVGRVVKSPACPAEPPVLEAGPHVAAWQVYQLPIGAMPQAEPAVFRPDGVWVLSGGRTVAFGMPGDRPLAADWNGDGFDDLILYRPSSNTWLVDTNLDGRAEMEFQIESMQPGDQPLAADWDGDGKADPGWFRANAGLWQLWQHNGTALRLEVAQFGQQGETGLAGDWGGTGFASIGIRTASGGGVALRQYPNNAWNLVQFGTPQGLPVPARWAGTRTQFLAFVEGSRWTVRLGNGPVPVSNPAPAFTPELPAGTPVAGRWLPAR